MNEKPIRLLGKSIKILNQPKAAVFRLFLCDAIAERKKEKQVKVLTVDTEYIETPINNQDEFRVVIHDVQSLESIDLENFDLIELRFVSDEEEIEALSILERKKSPSQTVLCFTENEDMNAIDYIAHQLPTDECVFHIFDGFDTVARINLKYLIGMS